MEAPLAGGARSARRDQERLVGGEAKRAGQRAAVGLPRLQGQADGLVAAEVEVGVDAVAGVGQADDGAAAGHPALAAQVETTAHVVKAVAAAEGRQQLEPGRDLADVQRDRRSATRRPARLRLRPPQHGHQLGVELIDVEAPLHQREPVPLQADLPRVQPRSVYVVDRQTSDGEVAPDVAVQAIDVHAAVGADLQSVEQAFDEGAPGRRDRAEPRDRDEGDQGHHHPHGGDWTGAPPAFRRGPGCFRLRRLGFWRLRRQKLCPMLM